MDKKRRYALVTGGSRGLGKQIAMQLLKDGVSVGICARNKNELQTISEELRGLCNEGQKVATFACDVSDQRQIDELFASVFSQFPSLDILVNNAGIYGPMGSLESLSWTDWVRTIEINVFGTVYACRCVLPHFKSNGYGRIVNLSGGGATSPLPFISAYGASKAAIVRFTESLAHELDGENICVNAVAPGALNTQMLDEVLAAGPELVGKSYFDRMVEVKKAGGASIEIGAALCAFLASEKADGINGRLISAVWDPWQDLEALAGEIQDTDVYTLRRIIPQDRSMPWGNES